MDTEFSESSFAYAASAEVERRLGAHGQMLLRAPQIPTLRAERKLGYDIRFDASSIAVILQYKTGEFVSRSRAGSRTWPTALRPHYRVTFPSNHHQLPLLQRLESALRKSGTAAIVRYVAPEFREDSELSAHYSTNDVLSRSYHCRPLEVPADGLEHYLVRVPAAGPAARRTFVLSEPIEVPPHDLIRTVERLAKRASDLSEPTATGSPQAIPGAVRRVSNVLKAAALAQGADVDALQQRAGEGLEDRPALAEVAFALTLGELMGIQVGFSAHLQGWNREDGPELAAGHGELWSQ